MNALFKPPLMTVPQAMRFTADEFLALIDGGQFAERHIELVEGGIVELPPPGPQHGRLQMRLGVLLSSAISDSPLLWVTGDTAIIVDEETVCACDVAIVRGSDEARALRPDQIVVAIEVSVSTIGYDLTQKTDRYAQAGVAVIWVVDPAAAVIHVFARPEDGVYLDRDVVRFGEALAVPGTDRTITVA